jgi:hypothetical protein
MQVKLISITKTEFMVIGSRQRLATFDNYDVNVYVNNEQVDSSK